MDFEASRRNMIDGQVLPNRVTDPAVIAAMEELPREAFVPKAYKSLAYMDRHIPLGGDRYIMAPMATARLFEALAVQPDDVALVIGAGAGYTAAVMARLASTVIAVESDKQLAEKTSETLTKEGLEAVAVIQGDLAKGYPDQAPYDVIFINGAVNAVPQEILDQLGEGGRLIAVVNNRGVGRATLFVRNNGVLSSREDFDLNVPQLPEFESEKAFAL